MLSGCRSVGIGSCATDSVRVAASYAGAAVARIGVAAVAGSAGFTSQYSNHVGRSVAREVFVSVTSCRSSGSLPNGA
jgi:hypothetical protein